MARNNNGFWGSFYQGFDQGNKMVDQFRERSRQREVMDAAKVDQVEGSEYSPEQIAQLNELAGPKEGETWDEASQSYMDGQGNSRAVANVPQYENGGYNVQGLGQVQPKKTYSLGGETRDTSFTPDEVQAARAESIAKVYDQYDPGYAGTLRSQAQQMKLGKVQLEESEMRAARAKGSLELNKIQMAVNGGTMTEEEGVQKAVQLFDKTIKDGRTAAYEPTADGKFKVTIHENDKAVGSDVGTFADVIEKARGYFDPEYEKESRARAERKERYSVEDKRNAAADARADKEAAFNERKFAEDTRRFGLEYALKQQEAAGNASLRRAQAGYYSSAAKTEGKARQVIGAKDGMVFYNTPQGVVSEKLPEGVTAEDLFPKTTGLKPDADMSEEAGLFNQFKLGLITLEEFQAKKQDIAINKSIGGSLAALPEKPKSGLQGKQPWFNRGTPAPAAQPLQPSNRVQYVPNGAKLTDYLPRNATLGK